MRSTQESAISSARFMEAFLAKNKSFIRNSMEDAEEFFVLLVGIIKEELPEIAFLSMISPTSNQITAAFETNLIISTNCLCCGYETKEVSMLHCLHLPIIKGHDVGDSLSLMMKSEKSKCSLCSSDTEKTSYFQEAPNVLCLMLNRFEKVGNSW